jgi:transposase
VRQSTAAQRDVLRARITLLAADGLSNEQIAQDVGASLPTVCKWRRRAAAEGPLVLSDAARSGRPRRIAEEARLELVALACEPLHERGGRATPTLDEIRERALERGVVTAVSRSHLHRLLQACDVRPHRIRMWLHSPDPCFREKVTEICELYRNPPPGAVVVSVDEKTGMQALERPGSQGRTTPGRVRRQEFEYVRHGTQALIAAMDVHSGRVLATCGDRRTGDDLERFMETIAAELPDVPIHVVWDNLNIHRAGPRWQQFNARHGGRFHFHFTPIHASWVNQIELWFSILGRRCLRNASFASTTGLRETVLQFIATWNVHNARPFRWTFAGYPLQVGADPAVH